MQSHAYRHMNLTHSHHATYTPELSWHRRNVVTDTPIARNQPAPTTHDNPQPPSPSTITTTPASAASLKPLKVFRHYQDYHSFYIHDQLLRRFSESKYYRKPHKNVNVLLPSYSSDLCCFGSLFQYSWWLHCGERWVSGRVDW